jgi:TM2 domain-containing membrane protein YozV
MSELLLMAAMTDSQKILFKSEMNRERKDRNIALLLTLFFGGFGAHHFYLNKTGLGIIYALFCWTLIPALFAFFELFFVTKRTDQHNYQIAQEISLKIKSL